MPGYEFDVFISYIHRGNPHGWMHNNFLPRLRDCLDDHLSHDPKVFIDETMPVGVNWPVRLENALNRSKIMVAIFSPQYFRSRWCLAEWETMVARERLFGLNSAAQPHGLIFPILFSDSDNFPQYAKERTWHDLTAWNRPDLSFQQSLAFEGFHEQVQDIAIKLAKLLPRVPDWQPDWPTHRPDPPTRPTTPIPRFSP